jgi:hypothetical protein
LSIGANHGDRGDWICYPGGILQLFRLQDRQILRLPTAAAAKSRLAGSSSLARQLDRIGSTFSRSSQVTPHYRQFPRGQLALAHSIHQFHRAYLERKKIKSTIGRRSWLIGSDPRKRAYIQSYQDKIDKIDPYLKVQHKMNLV